MNLVTSIAAAALLVASSAPLQHFAKSEVKHLAGPFFAVPSLSSGDVLAVINPRAGSLIYAVLDCAEQKIRVRESATITPGDGDDVAVSSPQKASKEQGAPSPFLDFFWGTAGADLVCGVGVQI